MSQIVFGKKGAGGYGPDYVTLGSVATGMVIGGTTAAQLPNIPCQLVNIKTAGANGGTVYLGSGTATTVLGTATNTTCGFQLGAGQETGWMPIDNLNRLFRICDNATDYIVYIALNG